MSTPNEILAEFLHYYLHLDAAPEYAVLLRGKWGSGKTWFAKQELDKFKQSGGNYLYVSLYGINSFNEIEDEFFRQLHPILASKEMKFLSKLVKGAVQAVIKVDLDNDGKSDGSVSIRAPDLNLSDNLKDTSKFVLVFDDLERCTIDICSLLGYINQFVEHSGQKVILIAHEDEIIERDRADKERLAAYERIKEKLIGKTFEVQPDVNAAFKVFLSNIKEASAKNAINENEQSIKDLFLASKYFNLRHLRQALLDIERMLNAINDRFLINKEFISHLIQLYLVFSFEIKSGNLTSGEIAANNSNLWGAFAKNSDEDEKENPYKRMAKKYPEVDLFNIPLPRQLWANIFTAGHLDLPAIEEAFDNSQYFFTASRPDWVHLWHALSLPDEEVTHYLTLVQDRFTKREYDEIGVVRHIAGLFLWFSDLKIINKTKAQVVRDAKKYIDYLKDNGKIPLGRDALARPIEYDDNWAGLGYHSNKTTEFQEITTYTYDKAEEALAESYPAVAGQLLVDMKSDADKFLRRLVLCNHPDSLYYKTPLLHLIKPNDFFQIFVELTQEQRRTVGRAIEGRYSTLQFASHLQPERQWLVNVAKLLKREQANRKRTMSGFIFESVAKAFNEAANKLKDIGDKTDSATL